MPGSGTTPAAPKRSWKPPAIAAAVLIAAVIGGGLFFRPRRASALTEKDTVVLADFLTTTGDSVFDGPLLRGLRVQQQQSPSLNLWPQSPELAAMHVLGRPADD